MVARLAGVSCTHTPSLASSLAHAPPTPTPAPAPTPSAAGGLAGALAGARAGLARPAEPPPGSLGRDYLDQALPISPPISPISPHICPYLPMHLPVSPRISLLDQALLNMVGLVQARAAQYRLVAFVDVDERPPAAAAEMAAALAALRAGSQPFASLFVRPSWCGGACPAGTAAFAEMLRTGRCSAAHLRGGSGNGNATHPPHGGGGVEPDLAAISPHLAFDLASKVVGVPARMTTIRTHTATPAIGGPHAYAACLQHPVPLIERDPQGCHANQSLAQRSRALRRLRRR